MFDLKISYKLIINNSSALLFVLWWFTLPFGSKMLNYKVGFFTIYPNLLILLVAFVISIKAIIIWDKLTKLIIIILGVWAIQGAIQFIFCSKSYLAFFDLRTLITQFIVAVMFFNMYYLLKKELFFSIIIFGIRFYLITLVVTGFFESSTGIHIASDYTNILLDISPSRVHYAPVFIYGNPNDFCAHFLFFTICTLLLDKDWRSKPFLMTSFAISGFYFSFLSDSTFGVYGFGILTIYNLIRGINPNSKYWIFFWITSIVLIFCTFMSSKLILGPKYSDAQVYMLNDLKDVEFDDDVVQITPIKEKYNEQELSFIMHHMYSVEANDSIKSTSIRLNLLKNSIDFYIENPIFGIGPGQYYQRHIDHQVNHYTGTVTSAHNLVFEVISEYGLIGIIYFCILFTVWVKLYKKNSTNTYMKCALLISGVLILIIWQMPSSFLYLEIHKITLPILATLLLSFNTEKIDG